MTDMIQAETLTRNTYDDSSPATFEEDSEAFAIALAKLNVNATERMVEAFKSGRAGWNRPVECSDIRLVALLDQAVKQGDVIDIANYTIMLNGRGVNNVCHLRACAKRYKLSQQINDLVAIEQGLRDLRREANTDEAAQIISDQIDSLAAVQYDLTEQWNELSREIHGSQL